MTLPTFDWTRATREQKCAEFKRLDSRFGTSQASPLHHDKRCPIHAMQAATKDKGN